MVKYSIMKQFLALIALCGSVASAATVSDVKVKVLDGFGGDASSRDVKSLRDSGHYQDITADAEETSDGVVVTFSVFRKMRYQGPLVVKGNAAFGASKISSEAGLRDGDLYGELAR